MSKKFSVKQFLQLSAPQKMKLYKNDRAQYDKLAAAVKENFNPETDEQALQMLATNPKTKHLAGKE